MNWVLKGNLELCREKLGGKQSKRQENGKCTVYLTQWKDLGRLEGELKQERETVQTDSVWPEKCRTLKSNNIIMQREPGLSSQSSND